MVLVAFHPAGFQINVPQYTATWYILITTETTEKRQLSNQSGHCPLTAHYFKLCNKFTKLAQLLSYDSRTMDTLVNVTLARVLLNWLLMTAPNSHIFELLVQPFKSGLVVVASSASSIFFFFWWGEGVEA